MKFTARRELPSRQVIRLLVCLCAALGFLRLHPAGAMEILRLPAGGVQPQAVVTPDGTIHVVYLRGDPKASDVWYARCPPGETNFSSVIRVNSEPGSAVAIGTIRGPHFAMNGEGQPQVVWNGRGQARNHPGAPFLTSRQLSQDRFAPEKDVISGTGELDGGGAVAVRGDEVLAIWHGAPAGTSGETNRGVFISRVSPGKPFGPERRLDPPGEGVCGCCSLTAIARPQQGELAVLYRSAGQGLHRNMNLLIQHQPEGPATKLRVDSWMTGTCPMSSAALAWHRDKLLCAWETQQEIRMAVLDPKTEILKRLPRPLGSGRRKHPSLAVSEKTGQVLVVWVEDTGWEQGGFMAWNYYDENLRPIQMRGRSPGVPVWGYAAAFARPDGSLGVVF